MSLYNIRTRKQDCTKREDLFKSSLLWMASCCNDSTILKKVIKIYVNMTEYYLITHNQIDM